MFLVVLYMFLYHLVQQLAGISSTMEPIHKTVVEIYALKVLKISLDLPEGPGLDLAEMDLL